MSASSQQVWDRVGAREPGHRGFDDESCWLPGFALRPGGELQRPLVHEDVRATFSAIESLAGWTARTQLLDPADDWKRAQALVVAHELEDMAHALRVVLNDYDEMED
jgi:hypothetical protein